MAVAGGLMACAVVLAVALSSGAWAYQVLGTGDPGVVTRLGAPLLRLAADAAATVCVGSLAYTVFFTPPQPSGVVSPPGYAAARTAARWATGWAVAALLLVPFEAAASAGLPLGRVLTPAGMVALTGALGGPRAWLATAGMAAVVAVGCRRTLRWQPYAVLLSLAVLALLPPLAVGHSSSQTGHDLATAAIVLHVPAAVLWLGVLVALGRGPRVAAGSPAVLRRYRRMAAGCWLVLGYSGVVDALVLVPAPALITTGYGLLVVAKIVVLAVLGLLGVRLRRRAAAAWRWLLAGELVLLAATFGASVGLVALPPPAFVGSAVTGDQTLLGYDLVHPPTLARLALDWRVEVFFAPLCAVLAVAYLLGVRRLGRTGRSWPAGRTACWLGGCLVLLLATSSGLGRYGAAMFSLETASHMLIGMLAPVLFAAGSPLTLAEQALPAAGPDELPGPREWLAALRGGAVLRLLTQPLVSAGLFVAAPFLLYFTAGYDLMVRYHWAHVAMDAVFLVIGYLFAWTVVGADPPPRPTPHLLRLGVLLAAMPFDILFGAAVIGSHRIIGDGPASANMYSALALPWVRSLAADQRAGGVIALILGELAVLVALVLLIAGWQRADDAGSEYLRLVEQFAGADRGLPAEGAQPQAVGDHEQRGQRHGGAGDERVEQPGRGHR